MTLKFRYTSYILTAILTAWALLPVLASAAVVTSGSLLLSDPRPSQTGVSYTFSAEDFTAATSIQCVQLRLNTAADGSGSVPTGVTTTSSTLASSSLITVGSWAVNNSVNGSLRITNGSGEAPSTSGNIVWGGVTNGSTASTTYFAIFNTYTNTDCSTGPVDSTVVTFRYVDGALVELIIEPTLSFTVNGVADLLLVNGATTTETTSATSINFGNAVTASVNGVTAHDLLVSTNAPGGYTVYIRHTGQLTNGTHNIDNHTGTNGTPSAFTAPGTEAWGYTSEDSTLAGGTADRFTNPANRWAGFTTSNDPVMDNPIATTGTDTVRVGHQVAIEAITPAGTYQTTVIYTVASTY